MLTLAQLENIGQYYRKNGANPVSAMHFADVCEYLAAATSEDEECEETEPHTLKASEITEPGYYAFRSVNHPKLWGGTVVKREGTRLVRSTDEYGDVEFSAAKDLEFYGPIPLPE